MWLIHFNTLAYKRMWIVNDECFDIHASIYQWIKILAYGLYRLAMQLLKHPLSHFLKKKKIKKKKTEKNMKPNQDIWDVTKRKSSKDQHTQTLIFTLFN